MAARSSSPTSPVSPSLTPANKPTPSASASISKIASTLQVLRPATFSPSPPVQAPSSVAHGPFASPKASAPNKSPSPTSSAKPSEPPPSTSAVSASNSVSSPTSPHQ